jgi:Malate synthase, TIM barrel domain
VSPSLERGVFYLCEKVNLRLKVHTLAMFKKTLSVFLGRCLRGRSCRSRTSPNLPGINRSKTSSAGKPYKLNDRPAILFVRPRGLHMEEKHWGGPHGTISASFFDFGVYFLNNYRTLNSKTAASSGAPD